MHYLTSVQLSPEARIAEGRERGGKLRSRFIFNVIPVLPFFPPPPAIILFYLHFELIKLWIRITRGGYLRWISSLSSHGYDGGREGGERGR